MTAMGILLLRQAKLNLRKQKAVNYLKLEAGDKKV